MNKDTKNLANSKQKTPQDAVGRSGTQKVQAFGRSIFENAGSSTIVIHLNHARLAALALTIANSVFFLYGASDFFLSVKTGFPVVDLLSFFGGLGVMLTVVIAADLFLTGLLITRWLLLNLSMLVFSVSALWGELL